jgi:hypothetical protein
MEGGKMKYLFLLVLLLGCSHQKIIPSDTRPLTVQLDCNRLCSEDDKDYVCDGVAQYEGKNMCFCVNIKDPYMGQNIKKWIKETGGCK